MAKKDYVPSSDNEKAIWLKNFSSKLASYAATLKIGNTEIQSVNEDSAMFLYTLECLESIKMYNQQMTVVKDKEVGQFSDVLVKKFV